MATGSYLVYASYTNGLLPAGTYDFGTDGKLFIKTEEPEVKNGIYYESGALILSRMDYEGKAIRLLGVGISNLIDDVEIREVQLRMDFD